MKTKSSKSVLTLSTSQLAVGIFSLALAFGAMPLAAQNQNQNKNSGDNSATAEPLPGYPTDQSGDQSAPPPAPQEAPPPSAPDQAPPPGQAPPPPAPPSAGRPMPNIQSPYSQRQAVPPAPPMLTIPANTVISVRPSQYISSDRNKVGDTFSATLDQPLVANGWVVARKGQMVVGRVNNVKKSGHFGGVSQLGIELTTLNLVDGEQVTIQTQLVKSYGGSTAGTDVATVGATTGVGAVIGGAAGGGQGAGVGAGVGAIAGIAGVMVSHGRPTVVTPETLLSFQLATPIDIDTSRSRVALRPVDQSDYRGDQDAYGRGYRPRLNDRGDTAPPPPAPYLYSYPYDPYYYGLGYPYYGWGYYPGPVIGLGFGFGPRFGYYRGFRR